MNYILEHSGRAGLTHRFWNSGVSGWVHRQIATVYTEAEKDRSMLQGIWVAVDAPQHPPDRTAASLGRLDAHGLAGLRAIILTVIDDGNPQHPPIAGIRKKEWYLWSYQESTAVVS